MTPEPLPDVAAGMVSVNREDGSIHDLKTAPEFYGAVADGTKPFEVRWNDRNYREGDMLVLREWSAATGYTGRQCLRDVTFVLDLGGFIGHHANGYVVMGLRSAVLDAPSEPPPAPCTGITASWCDNCGACTCARYDGQTAQEGEVIDHHMDNERCPLHSPESPHAAVAPSEPPEVCPAMADGVCARYADGANWCEPGECAEHPLGCRETTTDSGAEAFVCTTFRSPQDRLNPKEPR